jgi:hypothetical protein
VDAHLHLRREAASALEQHDFTDVTGYIIYGSHFPDVDKGSHTKKVDLALL